MKTHTAPRTLVEAINHFADPARALAFMITLRWPDGHVTCPRCSSQDVTFLEKAQVWKCRTPHKQQKFSVKVGTVMEDSPIPLSKWLPAIWMLVNCKNGISSYELHRTLGVTQKTAWFMLHRIRLATQTGTFEKLSGEVEADETYIGGLARNMHRDKRGKKVKGTGGSGKAIVMGMLERRGKVTARVVPNTQLKTLQGEIKQHVATGSQLYTDEWVGYNGLNEEYLHRVINHAQAYAKGKVHTNGIENFWSLLKRGIKGTYVSVEPFHLFRYLDEQSFRFNTRKENDADRFAAALSSVAGRRLTYQQLIGQNMNSATT